MNRNEAAWSAARKLLPGGVNSPVRAFGSVGGTPVFFASGSGAYLEDLDGRRYLDFVGAWGPQILGHAHPEVVEAIRDAAGRGTAFGAPTQAETRLAEAVIEAVPSVEIVRMVNSGTEATMSAIRLARGFTGRAKILKFAGCYHGHADGLLVKAGSGALTFGVPDSAGVPPGYASETLVARYNDVEDVDRILDAHANDLAAIILEPVVGNMGVVPPNEGFLEVLRERCNTSGSLLIFDEVMTGFRVALGGAQWRFGITPDLTCLGKIIGGGLPVGAYGGRAEIMAKLSPAGPVYQAGTNSGNPIAMAAGLATLRNLTPALYHDLEARSRRLGEGLQAAVGARGVVQHVGSMMTLFWLSDRAIEGARQTGERIESIQCADDLAVVDKERYARFFRLALENGIYLPPSQFEAFFLSAAHTDEEIDRFIAVAREFVETIPPTA
jgi:glutamate-1-semialdehyde 2,1-aminomutase